MDSDLPSIPDKRYFTIGEVSELCLVKPYVLRYWEQEFTQLKPMKRRGNRRYYQHHEVLLIRRIRELLYDQGFTISGARNRLTEMGVVAPVTTLPDVDDDILASTPVLVDGWRPLASSSATSARALQASAPASAGAAWVGPDLVGIDSASPESVAALREALVSIRDLLS
jgi:DNA-binding transcriptional MerR regulator